MVLVCFTVELAVSFASEVRSPRSASDVKGRVIIMVPFIVDKLHCAFLYAI